MTEHGLVVARYRRHSLIEDDDGDRVVCQFQSRAMNPVVGDQVQWQSEPDGTGIVTEVLPRESVLTRIDNRGNPEIVAANLTQLVVVLAPGPAPDWFLLDRYLGAAALTGLKSVIVFNKLDDNDSPPATLESYRDLTDCICLTSARQKTGLTELAACMATERSALIGQSGVGKSSLINALLGDTRQAVDKLSDKGGRGRHTTTTAVLYGLPGGGELIDSPGVRDYAPYIADPRDVECGFKEFGQFSGNCRFDDCRHLAEPGCAVKAAVAAGGIAARRYESFKNLLELTESVQEKRR
ncbi:MAG: ribosome small subunit-dependent GTPase A [Gammaproteobacteria bacterium]